MRTQHEQQRERKTEQRRKAFRGAMEQREKQAPLWAARAECTESTQASKMKPSPIKAMLPNDKKILQCLSKSLCSFGVN